MVDHSVPFGHLLYAKKLQVMKLSAANDGRCSGQHARSAFRRDRWYRDFTLEALSRGCARPSPVFPVYRTYLVPDQPVSEEDRQIIERAISAAKRRNPSMDESIFNYLVTCCFFVFPPNLDAAGRAAHTHFVLKFQQTTGTGHGERDWRTRSFTFTTG